MALRQTICRRNFLTQGILQNGLEKGMEHGRHEKGLTTPDRRKGAVDRSLTHAGKSVFVVNVHQSTSAQPELQQRVLQTLTSKLGRQPHATIMAGDLNADPACSRIGYAQSNAEHMQHVDEALRRFVQETRGTLVSPNTGSWQEVHTGKMAKLDHLKQEVVAGRANGIGHQLHDHARVQFCVARELLQRIERLEEGEVFEPRHKLDGWVAAARTLEGNMREWGSDVTGKVQSGESDAGEASSQLLLQRDDIIRDLKKSNTPERRRHEGWMPHRSKAQSSNEGASMCRGSTTRGCPRGTLDTGKDSCKPASQ